MLGEKVKKGFTLIEMMVVIAIIAIIAAIAVMAIGKSMTTAKINGCAFNMSNIFKGLTAYALENKGDFPRSLEYQTLTMDGPLAQIPADKPSFGANCLFNLYQYKYIDAQAFLCPAQNHSTNKLERVPREDWFKTEKMDQNSKLMFDNKNQYGERFCDYAFDPRHRSDNETPEVIILADRPPTAQEMANNPGKLSPNHGKSGLNVLRLNGKVGWVENTKCGIKGDDIYEINPALGDDDTCCMP